MRKRKMKGLETALKTALKTLLQAVSAGCIFIAGFGTAGALDCGTATEQTFTTAAVLIGAGLLAGRLAWRE